MKLQTFDTSYFRSKIQTFDTSYFRSKSHFEEDGTQSYLVYKYFKTIANRDYISVWKSKGLSNESIKPPAASNISLSPALYHINNKLQVKFDGHCIK